MKLPNPLAFVLLLLGLCLGLNVLAQDTPLVPGENNVQIRFKGQKRSYLAWLPENYDAEVSMPLVVALHGTGGSASGILEMGRLSQLAEREGFIVVAPNALGRAFNDGSGRGGPKSSKVDDVGFIEVLVSDVGDRANVDESRVFLAGFASGASMAQRVAVEGDGAFFAFFAVAGHLWIAERAPAHGRPLLLMWGGSDRLNPSRGGEVLYRRSGVALDKPPPASTAADWARRLKCGHKFDTYGATPNVRKSIWQDCQDGAVVESVIVDGLGHHWPGGRPVPLPDSQIGPYSDEVNGSRMMWSFFTRY